MTGSGKLFRDPAQRPPPTSDRIGAPQALGHSNRRLQRLGGLLEWYLGLTFCVLSVFGVVDLRPRTGGRQVATNFIHSRR
jgi:hypothetical protein